VKRFLAIVMGMAILATVPANYLNAQAPGAPEWVIHLTWCVHDTGYVEPVVVQRWAELGIKGRCTNRASAMRMAVDAAMKHDDLRSYQIAASNELHNPEATNVLQHASVSDVANWLRAVSGDFGYPR